MPATLTRIILNRHHRRARNDLAYRPGLHKTMMRLLPHPDGPHPRKAGGLLFRLDPGLDPVLLVQTADTPHLAGLPDGYGDITTRDLTPILTGLTPHLPVRYRITAAPVVSRSADAVPHPVTGRLRGKLTPLTGPDAIAWWQRRAPAAGLHLTSLPAAAPCPFPSPRPGPYERLTQFDGTATISEPALLATAIREGIGRGKAYGAGLLTLIPG
ncbi:type I-E CRISPR-associated protein Cas6/Cse3/CasE [Streptomyces antimycoticus]|uniref:type I-E CRISPR-associated protein Cas6/Cse3/CasE n=1 Tax=Streptomyces antimycoticus TaxID=68175 RepID=UPI0036AF5AB4